MPGTFQPALKRAHPPLALPRIRRLRRVDVHTPTKQYVQRRPLTASSHATPPASSPQVYTMEPPPSSPLKAPDARYTQWKRWTQDVLPKLIPTYLELLKKTGNLVNMDRTQKPSCNCGPATTRLEVLCVSFDGLSKCTICTCNPPVHLVAIGYFPCAPLRPSLAVDIRMLEFMRELYVRSAPNRTAWASALESVYANQGLLAADRDIIRHRLSKAGQYYSLLHARVDVFVRQVLVRANSTLESDGGTDDDGEWVEESAPFGAEDYLKRCCPTCFSGLKHNAEQIADVIVCLDANFTQKRRTPARGNGSDPPIKHPRTCFLSAEEVEEAKKEVESKRGTRPASPPASPQTQPEVVEDGMKVPPSVLDGCHDSFKAADEKRVKASTKFFAETGLFALLCRHDQPLWLANMNTPGEPQYFAIALLTKLFRSLPSDITVGVLYDVGCQLERSCRKWGLISEFLDRIAWAISIFHAYGHQWPCQLIYHPRKRTGFGLSDGEGCERFWSAIQQLIPSLRVSGYHHRILVLDFQVEHLRQTSLLHSGKWILRKWISCSQRIAEALETLENTPFDEDVLWEQWRKQVATQTQPFVRATKGLAKKEIQAIIDLMDWAKTLRKDITTLDRRISTALGSDEMQEMLETRLSLETKEQEVRHQIETRRNRLGVSETVELKKLLNDKYLALLVQAKAVKGRLRTRVQARRFELERLDRAYQRGVANDERKLHGHLQSQINRHQSGITSTLARYNTLCSDMEKLVRAGKAPKGATAPIPLARESLFSLDVDDPIWDDTGLDDAEGQLDEALWLCNEEVRGGIKALLMVERCEEELARLKTECRALHQWVCEEWSLLIQGLVSIDDENIQYQIGLQLRRLVHLSKSWKASFRIIPYEGAENAWVPENGEDILGKQDGSLGAESDSDDDFEMSQNELPDEIVQEMELLNIALDTIVDP
ncbi:hypothetical protein BKA70DRAFT_1490269 [Coprinopsis sp. MPI-PUGE-AT-0042]|nr:hypothetical protein BKA70DRAFT_1490269 [Coprinopsis sp. MPI-PUGE-AT-0042]